VSAKFVSKHLRLYSLFSEKSAKAEGDDAKGEVEGDDEGEVEADEEPMWFLLGGRG
jgi:hypothetical protein